MSTKNILIFSGGRFATYLLDYLQSTETHFHAGQDITSGEVALANGGTGTDMSTGLGFWQQTGIGEPVTAAKLSANDIESGILGADRGGTGINNATRTLTISNRSGTILFSSASSTLTVPVSGKALVTSGTYTQYQIPFSIDAQTMTNQAGFEYNSTTHQLAVSGIRLPVTTVPNYPATPAAGYFVLYGDANGTPTVKSSSNALYQMIRVGADLATTGSGFLKQSISGGAVCVAPLSISDIPSGLYPPIMMYWTGQGDINVVIHTPMVLGLPYQAGSGYLTFQRASGTNQNAFTTLASGNFPISVSFNDVFRVTANAVPASGWKSATFPRIR